MAKVAINYPTAGVEKVRDHYALGTLWILKEQDRDTDPEIYILSNVYCKFTALVSL